MIAKTDAEALAADVATAIICLGATTTELIDLHILKLVHRTSQLWDVELTMHPDPEFVNDVQTALAKNFSLNALIATPEGFVSRSPDEIGMSVVERAARPTTTKRPGPAPLGPPPPGLLAEDQGTTTTITLPGRRMPMGASIGLPGFAFAVAVFALCVRLFAEDGDKVNPLVILVPFLVGCAISALLYIVSHLRMTVLLKPSGVSYQIAPLVRRHIDVPWESIQDVTLSKGQGTNPYDTKRLGVLITTNGSDHWIGQTLNRASLDWIRDAILAEAAEVARTQPPADEQ